MSQISPFPQISMLLEDKELKKSIPLQINRGRGRAFAERNQKINSKNHEIFQVPKPLPEVVDRTSNFGTKLSDSTFK